MIIALNFLSAELLILSHYSFFLGLYLVLILENIPLSSHFV